MDILSVTVGLPVTSLPDAVAWYQRTFELGPVELEPVEGMAELTLGPVWLQLMETGTPGGGGQALRVGVADAGAERERLTGLGIECSELISIPGVIDFLDLTDPWGNQLSLYSEPA